MLDASEGPLDWLRRRKDHRGLPLIDVASHAAGERLRRDLTLATMLPRVTTNWDNSLSGRPPFRRARGRRGERRELRGAPAGGQALKAVGPDFADLLIDLCGFSKGLACIEIERGWPARSAKIVVQLALARLADHYGLERAACGPAHSRGIRTWHSAVPADENARRDLGRSVSTRRGDRGRVRVALDAVDHRAHAVRALRREVLGQAEVAKEALQVDGRHLRQVAGEQRDHQRDEPAHDVGVAVAAQAQDRLSARRSIQVSSHTWLAQPCTLLASLCASSGSGGIIRPSSMT